MDPQTPVPDASGDAPEAAAPSIGTSGDVAPDAAGHPPRRSRRLTATVLIVAIALIGVSLVGLGVTRPWEATTCAAGTTIQHPEWSVARRWDEATLDAIRRALPNPPVHARNLFHTSVAMWDAWATFDPTAAGYIYTDKHTAGDVAKARNEAISYAAYDVLYSRFVKAVGGSDSISEFADVMESLCYPITPISSDPNDPANVGKAIAASVIGYGLADGSNQAGGYQDPDYKPVNAPLVVAQPGTTMIDPNRWQPLQIEHMISQNGIPVTNGVQQAIGPYWGHVKSFALPDGATAGTPIDPGPPPRLGDPATDQGYKDMAVEVIRDSSLLDAGQGTMIDVSPAARGNDDLGTNDGHGHPLNPATGQPYPADHVNQGDFYRVMAEFWADGPKSETPPGHWNVLANAASDELGSNLRIGGSGQPVDRLQWDVKLYLALNGAVHDAAIAAWGLKGAYDSVRPISMIRYLAGRGQSSDPSLPSYDKEGIPLVRGLVELITKDTTKPGAVHAALKGHEGEIAIKAWAGNPQDPKTETGGVSWILAANWVPYQLPTFVTPSFQGYASGHSSFSRAAAEVMTSFTGSEYFPGGISGYTIKAGSLKFEKGPTTDIRLEWATYYDAADQAGQSRLYGGIHIQADDFNGRIIGSQCGKDAFAAARLLYAGHAPS